MTAIIFMPRLWLTQTLTRARRQRGRIAVISLLAGLSIAVGMAFPYGGAEAQGSHQGYAYTERVCQEYGQQPRRYYVRDAIPGSDWRSDGGWAIVLVNSVATRDLTGWRFSAGTFFAAVISLPLISVPAHGVEARILTDYSDGRRGFVRYTAGGTIETTGDRRWHVIIDQETRTATLTTQTGLPTPSPLHSRSGSSVSRNERPTLRHTAPATSAGPICSGAANSRTEPRRQQPYNPAGDCQGSATGPAMMPAN